MAAIYQSAIWLNPVAEQHWDWTQSTTMIRQVMGGRMYPLTLEELDRAMRQLMR